VTLPRRRLRASLTQRSAARIVNPAISNDKPAIFIRRVRGMGRGVFAGRQFRKGEVIEVCPVIPIPRTQSRKCRGEILDRYLFWWPVPGFPTAIALGFGSIYNHSPEPNATFATRVAADAVVFRAARVIEPGEQLFVDYEWPTADYHFPVTKPVRREKPRAK
jgi:uncharacterized protein